MDDFEFFVKDDNELKGQLNIVKYINEDIGMDFWLDKCAKLTFKKWSITERHSINLDIVINISELRQEKRVGTYILGRGKNTA